MTTITPHTYVAPPTVQPHRFGLFSAANMVGDPEDRFEGGVEWEALHGLRASGSAFVCSIEGAEGWPLEPREGGEHLVQGSPFLVVGSYSCSIQSRDRTEAENRARQHLFAGEERVVEYALATGALGNEPSFQGAEDLTPAMGAVDVVDGFGILEGYLGAYHHSAGVIHAPRKVAPEVSTRSALLSRQGNHLETILGTYVAFGGGYDLANVGPDGEEAAPGTAWLYGTARPQVRRSAVDVTDEQASFGHRTNDFAIYATRAYVVAWDPITVAVNVEAPEPPA